MRSRQQGRAGSGCLTVILALIVIGSLSQGLTPDRPDRDPCTDKVAAFVVSHEQIRQILAAPSSAKFPLITAPGVIVENTRRCEFIVTAYVDAQNAFGAMLRKTYIAAMFYDEESSSWRAVTADIIE